MSIPHGKSRVGAMLLLMKKNKHDAEPKDEDEAGDTVDADEPKGSGLSAAASDILRAIRRDDEDDLERALCDFLELHAERGSDEDEDDKGY